ncbi:MAG: hypothetical protein AB7T86_04925 [Xanthobacteraceae bacterium]
MSRRSDRTQPTQRREMCASPRHLSATAPCADDEPTVSRRNLVLGTIGVVSLGVAAAAAPYVAPQIYEICCQPVCDKKPTRVHAILVDCSDVPLDGTQTAGIDTLAQQFIDASRSGDHVIIAKLRSDAANPTEIISEMCDPGRADEKNIFVNTYDPNDAERMSAFVEPWRSALQSAKKPSPLGKTPLVEGIKQLAASLGFSGSDPSVAKRLLIVSDILMNSGPANSYKEDLSQPNAKAARAYIRDFIPALANCQVTIGLLARHQHRHRQIKQQLAWFEDYLKAGGATSVAWVDLR